MRISLLTIITILLSTLTVSGQEVIRFDNRLPLADYENVHAEKIFTDERTSTFLIWVKQSVAMHYHAEHTEQVYVLEGTCDFEMDNKLYRLSPGDYIIIPAGVPHAVQVTSDYPVKVLSIQAPEFDGSDRIYIKQAVPVEDE